MMVLPNEISIRMTFTKYQKSSGPRNRLLLCKENRNQCCSTFRIVSTVYVSRLDEAFIGVSVMDLW